MTETRKKIEKIIDETIMKMDPTGINAKKYRDMFQVMSDKSFEEWIEKFIADEKSNFRVDIEEFGDRSRSLKFENIEKAADHIGIKLFEYIYDPHVSSNPNRPIRSKKPVLVGYLNIKPVQQLVTKKTGLSTGDNDRDDMTNKLKGDSKGGTMTGIENELLAGVGADEILSEFVGARADNMTEYNNMLTSIAETGSVKLEDIKTGVYDKPTLLQADLYFAAMGIKTDIVSPSYYSIDKIKSQISD